MRSRMSIVIWCISVRESARGGVRQQVVQEQAQHQEGDGHDGHKVSETRHCKELPDIHSSSHYVSSSEY